MVSKTDDISASVPNCNPVDLADDAGDGAQEDGKETSKTHLKDPCGCAIGRNTQAGPSLLPAGEDQIECPLLTGKRKLVVVEKKSHDGACPVKEGYANNT
ncbi:hypothetical protein NQZ68_012208 [Dissostichus eleginoides]|nr:hypothetical protein NQZ68_012208 [Dissostichus eleginoides]